MGMKLETWTSIAVFGLSVMFVALLLSFYNFLIGPEGEGPPAVVEPGSLLLQEIFISAAPCLALTGFVFGMTKSFGTRPGGILLMVAGIVMVAGMIVGATMLPRIDEQYIFGGVAVAPYFFMVGGAGVAAVGGYLFAISNRSKRYSSLDDLR